MHAYCLRIFRVDRCSKMLQSRKWPRCDTRATYGRSRQLHAKARHAPCAMRRRCRQSCTWASEVGRSDAPTQPDISEFSFGFALTNELITHYPIQLVGAPRFPTQTRKARRAGTTWASHVVERRFSCNSSGPRRWCATRRATPARLACRTIGCIYGQSVTRTNTNCFSTWRTKGTRSITQRRVSIRATS